MIQNVQDKSFVTIPGWVVTKLHLNGDEAIVYSIIYGYKGSCSCSIGYIASWTGCGDRQVQRILRNLEKLGLITIETNNGKANVYKCMPLTDQEEQYPRHTVTPTHDTQSPHPRHTVTPINNDIYNNIFLGDKKKEKMILLEEFFVKKAIYQPVEEVERFWNYHSQTGWMLKGQPIINKQAAVTFWRLSDCVQIQSEKAKKIISKILEIVPDQKTVFIFELINIDYENDQNQIVFYCQTERIMHIIEDNKKLLKTLASEIRIMYGNNVRLTYMCKEFITNQSK